MPQRSRSGIGLIRIMLAALMLAMSFGMTPRGAGAQSTTKSFTSSSYAFTVSWDTTVWTGTPLSGDAQGGVSLSSPDYGDVAITGFPDATADLNGCVNRRASKLKKQSGVSNFKQLPASDFSFEAASDAAGAYYSYTQAKTATTNASDSTIYIECSRGAGDSVLRITFVTGAETFAESLSAFQAVYDAIDATGANTSAGSTGTNSGPSGRIGKGDATATPDEPAATATVKPATASKPVLKGNV